MSLGLVNNTKRKIYDGNDYDVYFPKPKNKNIVVLKTNDVTEVVPILQNIVTETLYQTEKLAPLLRGKNTFETAKNIWLWCKDNFNYATEDEEQLREPARAYKDRFAGIDCDCFTILTSSILTNLDIPHSYRLAKYNLEQYQHIYIIIPDSNSVKGYITLDCVKDAFNLEHPFTENKYGSFKNPLDIKAMSLEVSRLSGFSNSNSNTNNMMISHSNAQMVRGYSGEDKTPPKTENPPVVTEEKDKTKKESIFSNPIVWIILIAIGLLISWKMGLFGGDKPTKGTSGLGATGTKTEQKLKKELQAWEDKEKNRKIKERISKAEDEADKKIAAANARARAAKKA